LLSLSLWGCRRFRKAVSAVSARRFLGATGLRRPAARGQFFEMAQTGRLDWCGKGRGCDRATAHARAFLCTRNDRRRRAGGSTRKAYKALACSQQQASSCSGSNRLQSRQLPFRSNACAHLTWRRGCGRSLGRGRLQILLADGAPFRSVAPGRQVWLAG
jgi:hypothetical protein